MVAAAWPAACAHCVYRERVPLVLGKTSSGPDFLGAPPGCRNQSPRFDRRAPTGPRGLLPGENSWDDNDSPTARGYEVVRAEAAQR